jgi:hypothetical protein
MNARQTTGVVSTFVETQSELTIALANKVPKAKKHFLNGKY